MTSSAIVGTQGFLEVTDCRRSHSGSCGAAAEVAMLVEYAPQTTLEVWTRCSEIYKDREVRGREAEYGDPRGKKHIFGIGITLHREYISASPPTLRSLLTVHFYTNLYTTQKQSPVRE